MWQWGSAVNAAYALVNGFSLEPTSRTRIAADSTAEVPAFFATEVMDCTMAAPELVTIAPSIPAAATLALLTSFV